MNQNLLFFGAFVLSAAFSLFLILKIDFSRKQNQGFFKLKQNVQNSELYNTELADKLFKEVRILCLVMTYSKNHKTKARHVKETWGKQCNKLVFISDQRDDDLGAVALPSSVGHNFLWGKTKHAFQYTYNHFFDDADWFVKADDDSYFIVENIRYMLYQYHHQTSLYFGHRFAVEKIDEGYMAGGGYILSKAAVKKFVTQILPNATLCRAGELGAEDFEMGACLKHNAILADERDEKMQKRFFPVGFEFDHLKREKDPNFWYDQSQYYESPLGSLDCCSDTAIEFHYIDGIEMYMLDYLTRNVHPFGLAKNVTEKLPRKLKLEEILRASDIESNSTNFHRHSSVHNIDPDEFFKR